MHCSLSTIHSYRPDKAIVICMVFFWGIPLSFYLIQFLDFVLLQTARGLNFVLTTHLTVCMSASNGLKCIQWLMPEVLGMQLHFLSCMGMQHYTDRIHASLSWSCSERMTVLAIGRVKSSTWWPTCLELTSKAQSRHACVLLYFTLPAMYMLYHYKKGQGGGNRT